VLLALEHQFLLLLSSLTALAFAIENEIPLRIVLGVGESRCRS